MADYKNCTIKDIMAWCKENGQIEWLKAKAAEEVEYKVYPKKKAPKIDKKTGEQARNAKGELVWTTVADKSKEPSVELRPISFVQLKTDWIAAFGLGEPKAKKKTMFDMIAEL